MKIVLARQRIGAKFGGAEGYVAMLAVALRSCGADVSLMAQSVDEDVERAKFPVIRAKCRATNLWGVWSFAQEVAKAVKEQPTRILISFDRIPGARFIRAGDGSHAAYLESMGQTTRAKFSVKHQMLLSLERRTFTNPDLKLVIANSKMVAEEIRERYGVPADKIRVVPTGLMPCPDIRSISKQNARANLKLSVDDRVILFAGHNYERKGLVTILKALRVDDKNVNADAQQPKWTVLVAGRGDITKHQTIAGWMGLGDSVKFLGSRDLAELFAAADIFVLPTLYDPLARVCLEAARAGLPVVTTRKNGFCEWIGAGEGFVLKRADDETELAGVLTGAVRLNLPEMGRKLQARTAHLTIEKNAEEILCGLSTIGASA